MVCLRNICINTLRKGDDDDDDDDNNNNNNNNNNNRKIPNQYNWKARHLGTIADGHIEHSAHTSKYANVRIQNFYHGE